MINEQNYFSLNNRGLSQSKIKLYLQCPNLFYRSCISGELKKEFKKAFEIGDAVDNILTQRDVLNNYAVCEAKATTKAGKLEKDKLLFEGKKVLTRADYELVVNIADAVMKTEAYKTVADSFVFQDILQYECDLGEHFDALYGKPDAYRINADNTCDLLDIKTSVTVDDKKYYYKVFSYGYDKQLWLYSKLLKYKYPQITEFRYWHLAVEKSEPFAVKLFRIPSDIILKCNNIMEETINKIIFDKKFTKANPSFNNYTDLCDFQNESHGDWDD